MCSLLARASLNIVISSYEIKLSSQIALLANNLQGLVYLHDIKGIIHRNIKPSNLGILAFNPSWGVILDLNAAMTEKTSDNHL